MARGDIIGHIGCPICGFADAQVKLDKNERAYIYCEDGCQWQGITRHPHQDKKLRARMRPVAAPEPLPAADPAPTPPPVPAPAARAGFRTLLG